MKAIDHIGIMVYDIAEALPLFRDALGGEFVMGADNAELGVKTMQFRYPGGMKIELIAPIREESYLRSLLDKRGSGFHHLTILVDDLDAYLVALEARGVETTGTNQTSDTWKETYIRPASGFGTLLQVAETLNDYAEPMEGVTVEMVLAGDVIWTQSGYSRGSDKVDSAPD